MNYETAYKVLFNAITDALAETENEKIISIGMAQSRKILKQAQQTVEEMYIESD